MGDVDGAIESYHQALSMKPEDTFSGEMLNRALHESFTMPDPLFDSEMDGRSQEKSRRNLSKSYISQAKSSSFVSRQSGSFHYLDSSEDRGRSRDDSRRKSAFSLTSTASSNLSLDVSDVDMSFA